MENNSIENLYLIDLSYAPTPADIVFELSTIIEQDLSHNQRIYLKLGNVDLNQSQLLSIKSLINSINSTLVLVSSESQQTELAAATLGFLISNNAIEEENEQTPPSSQYVAMTEHLDNVQDDEAEETTKIEEEEIETVNEEISDEPVEAEQADEQIVTEEHETEMTAAPEIVEEAFEQNESVEEHSQLNNEEIQAHLDSIFDSEVKLESILADETEKYPLAQEASQIEIPTEEELSEEDYLILKMPTKYIKQTVRSGQVVKADGNVVIIGDCHPGSEVHAQGDITVWGALGGIAHAGCEGNKKARIRALQLNAIQLRIGEFYARRPDASNIVYVEKTNTVIPEEARIINDNIVILKLND